MTTPHTTTDRRRRKLPDELNEWLRTPGGELFRREARRHIYRGGKMQRPLKMAMTARERGDLIQLFGSAALGPSRLDPAKAGQALVTSRYALTLRALLIAADGPLRTGKGRVRYDRLVKRHQAHIARQHLVAAIEHTPQLDDERALLLATPPGTRHVPEHSRTQTGTWSVYASALKAAAVWWQGHDRLWKFGERELATRALGSSKAWTGPSQQAFCRIIGRSFEEAVHTADNGVSIQGPGQWYLESLVADFDNDIPFVEIPGHTAAKRGSFKHAATGILLIENQETFQAVHRTTIRDTWLRIFLKGFATDALVAVLQALPELPLAIWADLDIHGIEIVTNLASRLDRPLHPVAMDPTTYAHGFYSQETPETLAQWQRSAQTLARTGLPALRPLAQAIAAAGGQRCEQEGLHEHVLPQLSTMLEAVKAASGLCPPQGRA
ncbi:Wadjet anti-phage system protein JetD domain-containing protein [Streptomyces sp. NPDC057718]|uniref:Wadjet anti-phage system protein JetD domain-containing protein n=1 Tax=Streptomyces sp. NPDC057718 TaxID=3346225 RepID=UPI0036BE8405